MDPRQLIEELRLRGIQFTEGKTNFAALDAAGAKPGANPDPLAKATRTKLPKMTERQWQERVIEYAQGRGWKVAHFRAVRVHRKDGSVHHETPVAADGKGFPDLILVHKAFGKVVAAELKVGKNKTSPEQDNWLDHFAAALVPTFVWFPSDWDDVVQVLG
jgi:hypothetical protein